MDRDFAYVCLMLVCVGLIAWLLSGCSTIGEDSELSHRCQVECVDCKELAVKCDTGYQKDTDTETTGTISGPSID